MNGDRPLDTLPAGNTPVFTIAIASEQDVVAARQRARQVAEQLGFDRQDQIRVATAVSEVARNAFQYAGGGRVDFEVRSDEGIAALLIVVSDRGSGIRNLDQILDGDYRSDTGMGLGLTGARKLMDDFEIDSRPQSGTTIRLTKYLPKSAAVRANAATLATRLREVTPPNSLDEMQVQNRQLVNTLDELRRREEELHRLNQELEDTNRGVMALYAELDDKAESLRRADELKSRFLSHVSHEFRTPLNSILALARLLLNRVDGPLTQEQEKQIGYIVKASEDLAEMVNDLLDLAKVEAGKTVIHAAPVSVANIFGALRGLMRPMQTRDSVDLVIEEPDPALTLNTDEAKVSQILRNLVSNALKFTERGEVRVKCEQTPGEVVISVRDTGIGIPHEHQERIFQEFTQVENPLQRSVKGTGLGLPLSRKLAELLGGSLRVSSTPGAGSTFRFTLPATLVVHPDGSPSLQVPGTASEPAGLDVLLVIDDDEVSRYLIRQFLRGTGLAMTEADNGSSGLDRARFDRPRAILLDLSMPEMSGFEVLDLLRRDPETADIPVIIYTSRTLSASDRERLATGRAELLPKRELTREKFLAELSRLLGEAALNAEVSDRNG
jgi:signal transduction histidine kinase/CheY-like chemotaxis protein